MKVFSIVFAGLITSTLVLAGGNGGGYNGPDLQPVSIPVSLERGISLTAVGDAIKVCAVTGDEKSGLQSLAQKIAAQMGGKVKVDSDKAYYYVYRDKGRINFSHTSVGVMLPGDEWVKQQMGVAAHPSNESRPWSVFDVNLQWGQYVGLRTPSGAEFPYIAYEQVLNEGTYDDFGTLQQETVILGGLKVVAAVPEGQSLAQMPLINVSTQAASKFTVNAEEYIQCLQSELQKRAAK